MTTKNKDRAQEFFCAFEEHFRGSDESARERLQYYFSHVQAVYKSLRAPVLDLGAGRGEWVALLHEAGIPVEGVDSNKIVVNDGREKGLPIVEGDLLARLRETEPNSLSVISAFHVIESLPWEMQLEFFGLSARALMPNGLLILECQNVEMPEVAMRSFWMDPAHIRPMPMELLRFMAEFEGFSDSHVERLSDGMDIALLTHKAATDQDSKRSGELVERSTVGSVGSASDFGRGLNIIGHVSGNLGLSVFARQVVESLVNAGVPIAVLDVDPGQGRGRHDVRFDRFCVPSPESLSYGINLFLFPPGTMTWLLSATRSEQFRLLDRINVLWTMWELPVVPAVWHPALRLMDAVMGGSRFVEGAVAVSCDGPIVLDAPVPLALPAFEKKKRVDFGLPEAGVLFLSAFEPFSDYQRKNPFAAIKAFLQGAGGFEDAHLVIKINNAKSDEWREQLASVAGDHPRIHVLTESLSYEDTVALYACCDALISLHRAEGLGLVPMEFMALGKPVVATAWSGNMSYMTPDSACLVAYELIPVEGSIDVYSSEFVGQQVSWADPNVDEASEWVRALAEDAALRRRIGEQARSRMSEYQARANRCDWLAGIEALEAQYSLLPRRRQRKAAELDNLGVRVDAHAAVQSSAPDLPVALAWEKWADELMAQEEMPALGLVVLTADAYKSSLPRTLGDLDAQWHKPLAVTLVGEGEAPDSAQEGYSWQGDGGELLASGARQLLELGSEWVGFLHAGDRLLPDALFRVADAIRRHPRWQAVYTDEYPIDQVGAVAGPPHFKPDFNLDYLRSMPYAGGLLLVRRRFLEQLGGFDWAVEGIEEYALMLRAFESGGEEAIGHVSGAIYGKRQGTSYPDHPLQEMLESGRRVLAEHLGRLGVNAEVEQGSLPITYRVRYRHDDAPLVSIIIPTRNQRSMLERCLESLFAHTAWPNYEILVVDNGSDEAEALQYIEGLRSLGEELGGRIRVLEYPEAFNYSAMNNLAARNARGDYLLLLNNDTAALHDEWLDAMMAHAQRPEVGVVGAKLLYPDGKVQHAGVVLGMKGPAEHPFIGREAKDPGYFARMQVDQDYSAVTGACLLVRKTLFDEVGGLDADGLAVSYSDIDLCLKVRDLGKLVVWTPYAILLHEGSKSQKEDVEKAEGASKLARFEREKALMYRRWMPSIANDPAYNRHLSLGSTEVVPEPDTALCWDPEWRPAPRIIVQPADRMGCGEYRIIAPSRALINAGRIQGLESERIYTPPELARIRPDALVLQRQIEPHQIEAIEQHKRFNDVFCVFEIDDLMTNVPIKNAHKKHLPKDLFKRLRRAVSFCDRMVVATEPLAEAYRGLCADVHVVPNFIENARWGSLQPSRRVGRKPRVGWAGGVSHTGDLELIEGVVEALKDEVEWVFFGMCPDRLRPYVHEFHDPVSIDQYAQRLASLNLDLALAPLEDLAFNHAKSHLRLLEYGILGYPVVCSDLTPYQGDYPVTRVRNRFKDWVEAIRSHLADLDATAVQGDALRQHVRERWLLEENLDVWLDGWLPSA